MFEHYTIKNLTQAQAIQNRLMKMPKGERLAIKYNCLGCHKVERDLVGPSFMKIAKRYALDSKKIQESIKNGSKAQWQDYRGAIMPAFKDKICEEDIKILTKWILEEKR